MVRPLRECEATITQTAPIVMRSCDWQECPCDLARYITGPWSSCPQICGGNQYRNVACTCFIEGAWANRSDDECYFTGMIRQQTSKNAPVSVPLVNNTLERGKQNRKNLVEIIVELQRV